MSKFNLQGANISGNSIHLGDSCLYSSSSDFLKKNDFLNFTKTEQELVELIFENTSSDEERKNILESLKSIKNEDTSLNQKKNSLQRFKPLIEKLKAKGKQLGIELIKNYFNKKINALDIGEYFI